MSSNDYSRSGNGSVGDVIFAIVLTFIFLGGVVFIAMTDTNSKEAKCRELYGNEATLGYNNTCVLKNGDIKGLK